MPASSLLRSRAPCRSLLMTDGARGLAPFVIWFAVEALKFFSHQSLPLDVIRVGPRTPTVVQVEPEEPSCPAVTCAPLCCPECPAAPPCPSLVCPACPAPPLVVERIAGALTGPLTAVLIAAARWLWLACHRAPVPQEQWPVWDPRRPRGGGILRDGA